MSNRATDSVTDVTASQATTAAESNARKLRLLAAVLGLRSADIARAVGCSKALVSMILSEKRDGSPTFWFRLEQRLATLVERRQGPVFDTRSTVVPTSKIDPDLGSPMA